MSPRKWVWDMNHFAYKNKFKAAQKGATFALKGNCLEMLDVVLRQPWCCPGEKTGEHQTFDSSDEPITVF